MNIDLLSQRRGTTLFCYGPVLTEALFSAVPFCLLAGGLLMPIGTDPVKIVDGGLYFIFSFSFLFYFSFLFLLIFYF